MKILDTATNLISPYKIYIYIGIFFVLIAAFAFMQFRINGLENDLNKSKLLNSYYELQFKSLADSYKSSINQFEAKKETIYTIYKDRIKTAIKIAPDKECEYIKGRIKEYVENNITDNNSSF